MQNNNICQSILLSLHVDTGHGRSSGYHGTCIRPIVIISLFPVTIKMPKACGQVPKKLLFIGYNTAELLYDCFLHEYH